MKNRLAALAAGSLLVAGLAACSSRPPLPPQPPGALPPVTAHVIVAGEDTGTTHNVRCRQVGWSHTFEIGDTASGTTVVVDTGNQVTARSVEIRNIAGFSGSVSMGTFGNAQAAIAGQTFTVTGSALGYMADQPRNRVPQPFTIKVNC